MRIADLGAIPSGRELQGAFVVFCRYASGAWLSAIEAQAGEVAGVGLFVDDDIGALAADTSTPLAYRLRLWRLHLAHRRRLARLCDVLFVATPELAARYAHAQPHMLTPIAAGEDMPAAPGVTSALRLAFHSTSVHSAEHRWLRPVMQAALCANPLGHRCPSRSLPVRPCPGDGAACPAPGSSRRNRGRVIVRKLERVAPICCWPP